MQGIKNIIKRLLGRPVAPDMRPYIASGANSITSALRLQVRPQTQKKYLHIGRDSVVEAVVVIENEGGEVSIGDRTYVGHSTLVSTAGISIGNDVLISWGCTLMDNNAHSTRWQDRQQDVADWHRSLTEGQPGKYKDWSQVQSAPIRIGDKAWIGFNAIILKGVTIGEGAIVGAGSVVTKDVAPWTSVAGNPAKEIGKLEQE